MTATLSHGSAGWRPRKVPVPGPAADDWGLARVVLVVLEGFVEVGACIGGYGLVTSGSGMPAVWLDATPFDSWAGPGVLLLLVVAAPMTLATALELSESGRAFTASATAGVLLAGWIVVQVAVIGFQTFLQPAMLVVGLLAVIFAYLAHPST